MSPWCVSRDADSAPGWNCWHITSFLIRADVRRAVLAAMNARSASVADLARLNFLLGDLYADAVRTAQRRARLQCELVGCHGQTLYHQGNSNPYLGHRIACTWQTGEAAVIAAKIGVPVVSDFRPADLAAGGNGAPLVPFLDYVLYRHRRYGRIVQNLGGIGNLTAIPPRALPEQVIAFDTGPGNMVIDAVAEQLFDKPFDRNGRLAARGEPMERVLRELLRHRSSGRSRPKPRVASSSDASLWASCCASAGVPTIMTSSQLPRPSPPDRSELPFADLCCRCLRLKVQGRRASANSSSPEAGQRTPR